MTDQETLQVKVTFSLRDWKEGVYLLQCLGYLEEGDLPMTEEHTLDVDEDNLDELTWELNNSNLEYELEELEEE